MLFRYGLAIIFLKGRADRLTIRPVRQGSRNERGRRKALYTVLNGCRLTASKMDCHLNLRLASKAEVVQRFGIRKVDVVGFALLKMKGNSQPPTVGFLVNSGFPDIAVHHSPPDSSAFCYS